MGQTFGRRDGRRIPTVDPEESGPTGLILCNIKLAQKCFLQHMALKLTAIKQRLESVNRRSKNQQVVRVWGARGLEILDYVRIFGN